MASEITALDVDTTPALAPPPGITPNFVNPYSQAALAYRLAIAILAVATLAVMARLFTKLKIMKRMENEDCMGASRSSGFSPLTNRCADPCMGMMGPQSTGIQCLMYRRR